LSGLIGGKGYDFGQAFKESMGNVELVLEQLGIKGYKFVQDKELISKIPSSVVFHPGRVGALVLSDGLVFGLYGEIHPAVQEKLGLSDPAFIFEFQMQPIVENAKLVTQFRPYSIYPASTESISFIMGQNQAVGEVVEAIKELDERIVSISAGKPYTGDQIELGKKAVSFTLVYQSNTGSINEKDALTLREKVISSVKEIGLAPRV
jgi:phenylalanyl-tRNA synthetase beta chain